MSTDDAIRYLRRYQRWKRGQDTRDFDQTGLTPQEIGEAMETVLSVIPPMQREINSLRSRLAKCQIQREQFHSQLRKAANYPSSTDH